MSSKKKFNYKDIEDFEKDIKDRELDIGLSKDTKTFFESVKIGNHTSPNAFVIHPLEGKDANPQGKPREITFRRYKRYARGGAGTIWFEGTCISPESRRSKNQMLMIRENKKEFYSLLDHTKKNAWDEFGNKWTPLCIIQLEDVGRKREINPIFVDKNPYKYIPNNAKLISDREIEQIEDKFVESALLAKEIGFDGVDIKACHGYLGSDFLSAFNRKGKYGGSFANRTRFLLNIIDKIRNKVDDDFIITTRLNLYDGIPYPYGWGVDKEDKDKPDLTESIKLAQLLKNRGVNIINVSNGIPEYNVHLERPYDIKENTSDRNLKHPLEMVEKIIKITEKFQKAHPKLKVIGTSYSWLRHFMIPVGAYNLINKRVSMIGLGRMALAYPDLPKDLMEKGKIEKNKCCITCNKCISLLKSEVDTGCVVKDNSIYGEKYQKIQS